MLMNDVAFLHPVQIGSIVEFNAQVCVHAPLMDQLSCYPSTFDIVQQHVTLEATSGARHEVILS